MGKQRNHDISIALIRIITCAKNARGVIIAVKSILENRNNNNLELNIR